MGDSDRPGLKRELVELILEVAEVDLGEFPWPDQYVFVSAEGIDDLWVMEGAAQRLVAASQEVLAEIRRHMSVDIEELGTVRLGDALYQSRPKWARTIIEGQEKPLLEWLGEDLKDAINATAVRITAVRAIAKKRGQEPEVVEQTFYLYGPINDEHVLTRTIESQAPKYFANMEHGDRR